MQSFKLYSSLNMVSQGILKPIICSRLAEMCSENHSNRDFHTSNSLYGWKKPKHAMKWLQYNKTMWPPQAVEEERRPAYVCHMKADIRYSPKKMWYVACLVRGLSVEEAVKQLSFVLKKGALAVKETILEAQQMAIENHNVEYKSNLWIAESFVGKGRLVKGMRRHARMRAGEIRYQHCHYFVRLEEGKPPLSQKHYYAHLQPILSGQEMLDKWIQQMRARNITNSL